MLRVSLCVVVVHVALGLGVDDTEKRRSEEILRAVAAAATADYEGLQQMKFQKATTGGKISSTTDTHNCVAALEQALRDEKLELETSIGDGAAGVVKTLNDNANTIAGETQELKAAIGEAIFAVYAELRDKYNDVAEHAEDMEAALKAELNARTTDIGDQYTPEVLFEQIMNNAVQQLKADGVTDISGDMNGITGAGDIGGILKEMMLESARQSAMKHDLGDDNDEASRTAEEIKYIQVENLLLHAGAHDASNYATFNNGRPNGNNPQEGEQLDHSPYGDNFDDPTRNVVDYSGYGPANLNNGANANTARGNLPGGPGDYYTELERSNFAEVEQKFIDWTVAKSHFHNTSTKKTALDAAVAMVQAKLSAVESASLSVTDYAAELRGLEDDEMRKIHDIKEEFESLAADWLQLATYHCCDIVQGNAIECDDATAHLIAPINTVFPNALRKPNVQTDCTRRLL